jgi:hypothetical protein
MPLQPNDQQNMLVQDGAAEVAARVDLVTVQLTSVNARLLRSVPGGWPEFRLEWNAETSWLKVDVLPGFMVNFRLKARVDQMENGVGAPALEFESIHSLYYRIASGVPDGWGEKIQAFAISNGLVNAWPYARAEMQITFSRFGVPPLVLPLYRLGRPPPSIVDFKIMTSGQLPQP